MLGGHLKFFIAAGLVTERCFDDRDGLRCSDRLDLSTLAGLLQGLERSLGHVPRLRIRHFLTRGLHQRLQPRHDRNNRRGVLDDLAHVVDDEATCALDLLNLVVQAPREHWQHRCERGRLDILDEDAAGQFLHARMCAVDRLRGLHNEWEERLQVLVARAIADRRHAGRRSLLHLLLDITSELCHRHGQGHEHIADGLRVLLRERRDDVQRGNLLSGLRLDAKPGKECGHHGIDCKGARHLHDRLRRRDGRLHYIFRLVPCGLQDLVECSDEEGLGRRTLVRGNLAETLESCLSLFFVADLRDKGIDLRLRHVSCGEG
mmetsp:Transcript_118774/g.298727  ORF Transcript_118774/g.298727 Transcript_118774/m.298727 type:complete len:318 (-) Transcript_118774:1-954(-)